MRTVALAAVVLGTVLGIGGTARAEADPAGDTFGPGSIDVTDLSACLSATSLVVRLTFAGPISPPSGTPGNPAELYGYVDFDFDGSAATGGPSHLEQFGPMGAGTELGLEGYVDIPSWDPETRTVLFNLHGDEDPVPASFGTNTFTVAVPAPPGADTHLGAIIGDYDDATDVAPNTGFIAVEGSCCGNGVVDVGEDCDGGACCTSTCTFDDGAACNDGDRCTVSDVCAAGQCGGGPLDCDDGDPCFDDACDATAGCAHTDRTGFPGVICAFERTLPTACGGQTVDRAKLDKAATLVSQASSATGGKQKKLVKKARKMVKAMGKALTRAQKKDKLTIECADGVRAQLADLTKRLERVVGGG